MQTTLTRIFIVLESESHGLSEIEREFFGKLGNSNVFSAQKQVVSKRKKKVFTEIETDFSAVIGNLNAFSGRITTCTSQLRHPISFGGAVFNFSPKIDPKSTKNVRFCILHKPMGGAPAPTPPPPWLRYCSGKKRTLPTPCKMQDNFLSQNFRRDSACYMPQIWQLWCCLRIELRWRRRRH